MPQLPAYPPPRSRLGRGARAREHAPSVSVRRNSRARTRIALASSRPTCASRKRRAEGWWKKHSASACCSGHLRPLHSAPARERVVARGPELPIPHAARGARGTQFVPRVLRTRPLVWPQKSLQKDCVVGRLAAATATPRPSRRGGRRGTGARCCSTPCRRPGAPWPCRRGSAPTRRRTSTTSGSPNPSPCPRRR